MTDARRVRPAGKEQAHRLGVVGVHHQRAGVARIAEAIAAHGHLVGEELGEVGPGFGAVAVVVHRNVQAHRRNAAAGQARGPAAFRHPHLQPGGFAFAAGRRNARRCRGQRSVGLPRAQFEDGAGRIHRARSHLRNGRIGIGLRRI